MSAGERPGGGIVAEVAAYVRTRGWRAALERALRAFVYARERWVLTYKPMDADVPVVEARVPGSIRLARPDDVPALRVFSHHYTDEQFRRWVEPGDRLWVFEQDGRLLGYRLVTRELPRLGAARRLRLEPTDTFVTNAYTLEPFRGARIGAALTSHVLRANRARGFRREISLIRLDNEASRKMVGLAGAREIEEITLTRVLGVTWVRTRPAGARRYYTGRHEA
jgi:GNAT superfamily N-acetyltransferase